MSSTCDGMFVFIKHIGWYAAKYLVAASIIFNIHTWKVMQDLETTSSTLCNPYSFMRRVICYNQPVLDRTTDIAISGRCSA